MTSSSFTAISCLIQLSFGYHLSLNSLSWDKASQYCKNHCNSDLVSISSFSDWTEIIPILNDACDYIPYGYSWIWTGLYVTKNLNQSHWTDESPFDFGNQCWSNNLELLGIHPWSNSEPNIFNGECMRIVEVGYDNAICEFRWELAECSDEGLFMCNHCEGKIEKYARLSEESILSNPFGTSFIDNVDGNGDIACSHSEVWANSVHDYPYHSNLASVHSYRDMEELSFLCNMTDNKFGCWVGLNFINSEFEWSDGTSFDFGRNLSGGIYPWRANHPDTRWQCTNIIDRIYVADGIFEYVTDGVYEWESYDCDINNKDFICNRPSELCYGRNLYQWYIIDPVGFEGNPAEHVAQTLHECTLELNDIGTDEIYSEAILSRKKWRVNNPQEPLVIEMMFEILEMDIQSPQDPHLQFNMFMNDDNCIDKYRIQMELSSMYWLWVKEGGDGQVVPIQPRSGINILQIHTYYTLTMRIWNMTIFNITLSANGDTITSGRISAIERNPFNINDNNKSTSGRIGIKVSDLNVYIKSLFVSGQPVYDIDNAWYLQCNKTSNTTAPIDTPSPTIITLSPAIFDRSNHCISTTTNPLSSTMQPIISTMPVPEGTVSILPTSNPIIKNSTTSNPRDTMLIIVIIAGVVILCVVILCLSICTMLRKRSQVKEDEKVLSIEMHAHVHSNSSQNIEAPSPISEIALVNDCSNQSYNMALRDEGKNAHKVTLSIQPGSDNELMEGDIVTVQPKATKGFGKLSDHEYVIRGSTFDRGNHETPSSKNEFIIRASIPTPMDEEENLRASEHIVKSESEYNDKTSP